MTTVSTHAMCAMFQHALKIVVFGFLGFAFWEWIPLIIAMVASGFLGTVTGKVLLERLSERVFGWAFKALLTLLAARLIALSGRRPAGAGLTGRGYAPHTSSRKASQFRPSTLLMRVCDQPARSIAGTKLPKSPRVSSPFGIRGTRLCGVEVGRPRPLSRERDSGRTRDPGPGPSRSRSPPVPRRPG